MPTPQGLVAVTVAVIATTITLVTLLLIVRKEKEIQRNLGNEN